MPQVNRYQALIHQLEYLEAAFHLHICVKDYVGFIPIDKELSAALTPYLGHSNPYCMFIKQSQSRYYHCLSMMKKMANKCLTEGMLRRGRRIRIAHPVGWKASGRGNSRFSAAKKGRGAKPYRLCDDRCAGRGAVHGLPPL